MEIIIKNDRISRFYRENPTIDIESINLFFIDFIEKTILPSHNNDFFTNFISTFEKKTHELLTQYKDMKVSSSSAHNESDSNIDNILSNGHIDAFEQSIHRAFPTTRIVKHNDDFVMYRQSLISIHNNIQKTNTTEDVIHDFIRSTDHNQSNGIFIAHHGGIIGKPNFHIDIHVGRIFVFLNHIGYSTEKIKIAVNIIDRLYDKMREFNVVDKEWVIPKNILDEINREYQTFVSQKDAITNAIKESQRKIISQLDDLHFPSLEKFLSTKFSTSVKQGFKCDLCRIFTVNTLKGLAAHKRGCSRKNILIPRTDEINTFSIKTIIDTSSNHTMPFKSGDENIECNIKPKIVPREKNRPFSINI